MQCEACASSTGPITQPWSDVNIRTYLVYFATKYNAPKKWEVYAKDAFAAQSTVEELNLGCRVTRVFLSNYEW